MSRAWIGSVVGAVFGLVFLLVNAGDLGSGTAWVVRVLGVVAFAAVLAAVARARRHAASSGVPEAARTGFGRPYRLIVLAEVAAVVIGVRVITGPLDLPHAGVAWVALVVGVHFFGVATPWSQRFFRRLGAALAACGVAGLALAAAGASDAWVARVGGVLPGAVLLGFSFWGVLRRPAEAGHRPAAARPR